MSSCLSPPSHHLVIVDVSGAQSTRVVCNAWPYLRRYKQYFQNCKNCKNCNSPVLSKIYAHVRAPGSFEGWEPDPGNRHIFKHVVRWLAITHPL